jgi:carbon-monoxide dehydrogenase medium subunit
MIPSKLDYPVAESVDHAVELLGQNPDAKLLAGGHSLIPLMKTRLARPSMLIDIGRVGMSGFSDGGDHLVFGALTRHHDLEHNDLAKQHVPILAHTAGMVGARQVRHCGTIGGSCAHGDPASDLPTICRLLDATFVAHGPGGSRQIAAADFFQGFFQTALAENEVLTEIHIPKTGGAGWSYIKFRQRALDWATVGVAAVVNGGAKIAFTNMGQIPIRASAAEAAFGSGGAAAASAAAAEGTDPPSDTWATADFRRHLAQVLTGRALAEAAGK